MHYAWNYIYSYCCGSFNLAKQIHSAKLTIGLVRDRVSGFEHLNQKLTIEPI